MNVALHSKKLVSTIRLGYLRLVIRTVFAMGHTAEQWDADTVLGEPISGEIGRKSSLLVDNRTARISVAAYSTSLLGSLRSTKNYK